MINNHNIQGEWKIHSGNIITDYITPGDLTMASNFISSKDSDSRRINERK